MAVFLGGSRLNAPPVDLDDLALFVGDRDGQAPVQMLAAVPAIHSQGLEFFAQFRAVLSSGVWDSQAECAVGKSDFETLDQFPVIKAATGEIGERIGIFRQPLRVIVGDLGKDFRAVFRIERAR